MVLEVQLPGITAGAGTTVQWIDDLGHYLINEVDLIVGGITVVQHYGRWFHIYSELTRTYEHDVTFQKMIGNSGFNPSLQAATATAATKNAPTSKLYIPLRFWFCNNYALSFPMIACQYHDVQIYITFEQFNNLIQVSATSAASTIASGTSLQATLYVDYIYLDQEERRNFAVSPHEYLIEQLQFTSPMSYSGQTSITARLDGYNHPVKEIVWALQNQNAYPGQQSIATKPNDYTSTGATGGVQIVSNAKLQLNGNDRFSTRDGDYFNWVQPYNHHTRGPVTGIYVYSFATEPEKWQPTGTCNFSRIDTAQLLLSLVNGSAYNLYVYMTSYNVGRFVSGLFGQAFAA
jgi:hypothetical protein